jgi:hypothetical protein
MNVNAHACARARAGGESIRSIQTRHGSSIQDSLFGEPPPSVHLILDFVMGSSESDLPLVNDPLLVGCFG